MDLHERGSRVSIEPYASPPLFASKMNRVLPSEALVG